MSLNRLIWFASKSRETESHELILFDLLYSLLMVLHRRDRPQGVDISLPLWPLGFVLCGAHFVWDYCHRNVHSTLLSVSLDVYASVWRFVVRLTWVCYPIAIDFHFGEWFSEMLIIIAVWRSKHLLALSTAYAFCFILFIFIFLVSLVSMIDNMIVLLSCLSTWCDYYNKIK